MGVVHQVSIAPLGSSRLCGFVTAARRLVGGNGLLHLRAGWTHGRVAHGHFLVAHLTHTKVSATAAAAAREALEEAGTDLQLLERKTSFLDDHGNWRYDTVTAHTCGDAGAYEDNAKSEDLQWLPIDDVAHYELHLGLRPTWLELIVHVKTRCVGEFRTIPRSCEAGA
jgi:hypothetical protein